jgi:superfamily II DNA or RNA helicase
MRFTLHQHQTDALDMLRASLASGRRRPMLQSPTGSGKTVIAAAIVEGALRKGKRVLFTVPFLSLVDQTLERFASQDIHEVGVIQGHHPATDADQPVQIASVQTLMRRQIPQSDVVVIDEAHRWFDFYADWMSRSEWQSVPFIGLSATPWTKGLGKHYDDLLIPTTTKKLIAAGHLSPFKVFAPSHPDLAGMKTVAGDYHEGQLSEVMSTPTLVADVVATWLRLGEDRPTLCFAVDRAHARKLADQFEAAGVATSYVDKDTPSDERARISARLGDGRIKVVCNVATMTTGVDLDVRCIILARPTKSEILYCQIVGRGLRTAEGKSDCLILDHSDTTLRLGFADDIHHDALDDGTHRIGTARRIEKPTPLPKECTSCSYLKPAGMRKCPSCGFEPERQSRIEEMQGELIALKGRQVVAGPEERQRWFSMALRYADDHGHARGSAAHKFKEKFGTWPRGLAEVPVEPDVAFLNWVRSRRIAYAKAKKKAEATHAAA